MRCSWGKLRWSRWGVGAAAILLTALSWAGGQAVGSGQVQQSPGMPSQAPPFGENPNADDPMMRERMQKLEKARNTDRQKQLVADTDKLLSLARDLKSEVDKSNKDTLSVDVVKKAAEIEKLAKSVKERMRG